MNQLDTLPPKSNQVTEKPLPSMPEIQVIAEQRSMRQEELLLPQQVMEKLSQDVLNVNNLPELPEKTRRTLEMMGILVHTFDQLRRLTSNKLEVSSWRAKGWDEYLRNRSLHEGSRLNYFTWFKFDSDNSNTQFTQAQKAALTLRAVLTHSDDMEKPDHFKMIQRVRVSDDPSKTINQEIDMSQHNVFARSVLVPEKGKVVTKQASKSGQVAVMVEGVPYMMPVRDDNGNLLPIKLIEQAINQIQVLHQSNPQRSELISLSGAPMSEWGKLYSEVNKKSPVAKKLFHAMNAAEFVLCLDQKADTNSESEVDQQFRNGGTRNVNNRYPLRNSLIIPAEGNKVGFNWNHVITDGSVAREIQVQTQRYLKDYGHSFLGEDLEHSPSVESSITTFPMSEIEDSIKAKLGKKFARVLEVRNLFHDRQNCVVFRSDTLSKEILTKNNLSPDTVVQLAVLATLSRLSSDKSSIQGAASVVNCRAVGGRIDLIYPVSPSTQTTLDLLNQYAYKCSLPKQPRTHLQEYVNGFSDEREIYDELKLTEKELVRKVAAVRENQSIYTHLMAVPALLARVMHNASLPGRVEKFFSTIDPHIREVLEPVCILSNGGVDGGFGTVPSRRQPTKQTGTMAVGYSIDRTGLRVNIMSEGAMDQQYLVNFTEELELTLDALKKIIISSNI